MKNGRKKLLLSSAISTLRIASLASFAKPVSSKYVLAKYAKGVQNVYLGHYQHVDSLEVKRVGLARGDK